MTILQFSNSQTPEPTGPADYLTAVIVGLSIVYLSTLNVYAIYNYIHRDEPERNELNKKHPKALVLSSVAGCIWIATLLITHDHFESLEDIKNGACIVWTLYLEQFLGLSVLLTTNNMRLFYYYTTLGHGGSEYTTMGWRCIFKGKEIMFAMILLFPMFLICLFTTLFHGVWYDGESEQCVADPTVRVLVIIYIIIQFVLFVMLAAFNYLTISWDLISEKKATVVYIILVCVLAAVIIPIKLTPEINDRDGRVIATLASVVVVLSFHTMLIGRVFFARFFGCCVKTSSSVRNYSLLEMNAPVGGGNASKLIKDDMMLAYVLTKSQRFDMEIDLSEFDAETSSSSIVPFYNTNLESWDKIRSKVLLVSHFLRFFYNDNIEIKRKRVAYTPIPKERELEKLDSSEETEPKEVKHNVKSSRLKLKNWEESETEEREMLNIESVSDESHEDEELKTKQRIVEHSNSRSGTMSYRLNRLIGGEHISKEFRTKKTLITDLLNNGSKDFFIGLDMFDDEVVTNHSMNIVSLYLEMSAMKTQIDQLLFEYSEMEVKMTNKTDKSFTSKHMKVVKKQMYEKQFPKLREDFERCMLVYVFRPQDIMGGYEIPSTKLRVNFDKKTFNTVVLVYKILVDILKEDTKGIEKENTESTKKEDDTVFISTDLILYGVSVLRDWCEDKFRRMLYPIYASKDNENGLRRFLNDDSLRARTVAVMRSEGLLSTRSPGQRMTRLSSAYDLVRVDGDKDIEYVNTHNIEEGDEGEKKRNLEESEEKKDD